MGRSGLRGMLGGAALLLVLTACAGKGSSSSDGGATASHSTVPAAGTSPATVYVYAGPTATPRPAAPRNRNVPEGDPYDFDAPFTVGPFVRQTAQGRTTGADTGGVQASYTGDGATVVLTVYHFDDPGQAINTVHYVLENKHNEPLTDPFYLAPVSYGLVQDQRGGYLAAWSHYGWAFIVRTPGSLDALKGFLDAFPY